VSRLSKGGRDWPAVSLKLCPGRVITVAGRLDHDGDRARGPADPLLRAVSAQKQGVGDGVEPC